MHVLRAHQRLRKVVNCLSPRRASLAVRDGQHDAHKLRHEGVSEVGGGLCRANNAGRHRVRLPLQLILDLGADLLLHGAGQARGCRESRRKVGLDGSVSGRAHIRKEGGLLQSL